MFGRKLTDDELNPPSAIGGRKLETPKSTMTYHLAGPPVPFIPGGEVTQLGEPTEIGCRVLTGAAAAQALELNRAEQRRDIARLREETRRRGPWARNELLDQRLRRLGIRVE